VTVTQLPEVLNNREGRLLFKDLERRLKFDRQCIVLDCSKVRELDNRALRFLLNCLEEAMKRNGDVKLAAVTAPVLAILEQTRVDRLFEIYDTETEAVNSFFRPRAEQSMYAHGSRDRDQISESAA
jgi:anti-anti-sigma factor